jgi:orotate phosphoribosyltransferase
MIDNPVSGQSPRRGHFLLESGYHTDLWFDLDSLFLDPKVIAPEISALAELIKPFGITAVCGPLLGGAFLAQSLAAHLKLRFFYTQLLAHNEQQSLFAARYKLPPNPRERVKGEQVAVVDDVISAGSSVRATASELLDAGATVAVVGCLTLLSSQAREYFANLNIPVVANREQEFKLWSPDTCPLCREGVKLENPGQE